VASASLSPRATLPTTARITGGAGGTGGAGVDLASGSLTNYGAITGGAGSTGGIGVLFHAAET